MRWPNKHPMDSDMRLWRDIMISICPSRSSTSRVRRFTGCLHKIWRWFWSKANSTLHHTNLYGRTVDVFVSGRKPNLFTYSHSQPSHVHKIICSVQPNLEGEHWHLLSTAPCAMQNPLPSLFLEVLQSRGNTWLWEHMSVSGGVTWLEKPISDGTLVAVTGRLYIRELYPHLCSAAFILKCSKRRSRVVGSFLKALLIANTYRGELLGLMALHLILLSINKMQQNLTGSVEIVLDCLGALK
jgi:hypothetical protein